MIVCVAMLSSSLSSSTYGNGVKDFISKQFIKCCRIDEGSKYVIRARSKSLRIITKFAIACTPQSSKFGCLSHFMKRASSLPQALGACMIESMAANVVSVSVVAPKLWYMYVNNGYELMFVLCMIFCRQENPV